MAYKTGNRYQNSLIPLNIEQYVSEDDPVRAYDAFIELIDLKELGFEEKSRKTGRNPYDPKAMLKLLVYGYSYGWRSSRKLERALYHNISFIWLMGGLKPDHKTIAEFRRNNNKLLTNVLKKCSKICIELNLIEGNTLFLDGCKIRGNCSINKTKTKEGLERFEQKLDERISKIIEECEKIDNQENDSLVKLSKELQGKQQLKSKIQKAIKTIEEKDLKKINLTDEESVLIKSRQGTHAGYNAQSVVDEKHGLIVSVDVVAKSNDMGEFDSQIANANEVLLENCKTACADAGYSDSQDLKKSVDKKIEVIVPSQKQALHKKSDKPFSKDKFEYIEDKNIYLCPEGKILRSNGYDKTKGKYQYIIKNKKDCLECKYYGNCTTAKAGRKVTRLKEEVTKEALEKFYESDYGQEIYKKRKSKVELPFGHIKRNLNGGYFLLRGLAGVNSEMSINCTCFNLVRMLTLLGGVRPFIEIMKNYMLKDIEICS
jgi:transposase